MATTYLSPLEAIGRISEILEKLGCCAPLVHTAQLFAIAKGYTRYSHHLSRPSPMR
jgi:hypothetical protein